MYDSDGNRSGISGSSSDGNRIVTVVKVKASVEIIHAQPTTLPEEHIRLRVEVMVVAIVAVVEEEVKK